MSDAKLMSREEIIKKLRADNERMRNLLEDVVNELDLSEGMIEKHGPLGTHPAKLVRLVLTEKDLKIKALMRGFVAVEGRTK